MFLVFKQYYTHFHTLFHLYVFSHMFSNRDGNGVGRGRRLGSSFLPPMVLSCLIPASHDEENFLTPSPPLGTPQASPHKTLLFVNLSYDQYKFFHETYFINKNILEITTKFIQSNKINFQKKLNNISKCLTRQSQNK